MGKIEQVDQPGFGDSSNYYLENEDEQDQLEMIKKYSENQPLGPIAHVIDQYNDIKSETGSDLYEHFYQDGPENDFENISHQYQDEVAELDHSQSPNSLADLCSNIDIKEEISPIRQALELNHQNSPILSSHHLTYPKVGYKSSYEQKQVEQSQAIYRKRDFKNTKKSKKSRRNHLRKQLLS